MARINTIPIKSRKILNSLSFEEVRILGSAAKYPSANAIYF
jgi:hypothetical protein